MSSGDDRTAMTPIEKRLQQQQFWAFAAYDTIEPIWQRVEPLVRTGRRIIHITRWIDSTNINVSPGNSLHEGGFKPGANFQKFDDRAYFEIVLNPCLNAFGTSGYKTDGTESDAARQFYARRDGIRVDVEGFGRGRDDHVQITSYNEHGVGRQSCLYFDLEDNDERATREAAFLETLAAHGDWSAAGLRALAGSVRFGWEPAADMAAHVKRLP